MKKRYKILIVLFVVLALVGFWFYERVVYTPPTYEETYINPSSLEVVSENHFRLGNNWLKKNTHGNWESYIEGSPSERGAVIGILHKTLLQNQEKVFVAEIEKNVPNWFMRKMILLGIAWFNRDLDQHIPLEYRQEIYGISKHFSDSYDYIGPKYNRITNYHAAHDIGHAVQNMHLVGCTSFAKWDFSDSSANMVVARNFDFYFGDEFAKNKIVLFCKPDEGYRYASVTWAGFCGVVSGMNEKGLGITLNSAKSEIPGSSSTPVSIVARDILQYASNIEEAISISKKYDTFVSESFLISSAEDSSVAVIEKTPDRIGVYYPQGDSQIVVTNHFQSDELKNSAINLQHMSTSESVDRHKRTNELVESLQNCKTDAVVNIMRDQLGYKGENIGMSNPKAINQLLAHHAIIFKNIDRTMWVSNYPFQLNYFDAYDLNSFDQWSSDKVTFPVSTDSLEIAPDPFYLSEAYEAFTTYKQLKEQIIEATNTNTIVSKESIEQFTESNPAYYETYRLLGNYFMTQELSSQAIKHYEIALSKNIAYEEDREFIELKIKELK